MVYLRTLWVAQNMQCRMLGLLLNKGFEGCTERTVRLEG